MACNCVLVEPFSGLHKCCWYRYVYAGGCYTFSIRGRAWRSDSAAGAERDDVLLGQHLVVFEELCDYSRVKKFFLRLIHLA